MARSNGCTNKPHVMIFFLVAITHDDAIFYPNWPRTLTTIAETILRWKATECPRMIINGHNLAAELCRNVGRYVLSGERLCIREPNASPTPAMWNSPSLAIAGPMHTHPIIWANSDLEIMMGLAPAHPAYPSRHIDFGQILQACWKNHSTRKTRARGSRCSKCGVRRAHHLSPNVEEFAKLPR